nr:hypothetical protein [Deltaproteobacteria bacterium]
MTRHARLLPLLVACTVACTVACSFEGSSRPPGGALTVRGEVVNFPDSAAITGQATVNATALIPAPAIAVTGTSFEVEGILEHSIFDLAVTVAPTHRTTYNQVTVVSTEELGLEAFAVSEAFVQKLVAAFGATTATKGILFAHLVDDGGAGKAGIAASELALGAGTSGPFFLDANLEPAPGATMTSASGWVIYFEVPPGVVSLAAASTTTVTLDMPTSLVGAASVTLAEVVVTPGAPMPLPTNIAFETQILPIFDRRGCGDCHSKNGDGSQEAGLTLATNSSNAADIVFAELVTERPNIRVVPAAPETSLVLTMPSREVPADRHPNVTFANALDPDYRLLFAWIMEGARRTPPPV